MQVRNPGPQYLRSLGRMVFSALLIAGCADQAPTAAKPAVVTSTVGGGHDHPGMNAAASFDPAVPGGFAVSALGRGSFPDDIDMTFRIKLSNATNVVHVNSPSDALTAKVTVQPGGSLGWHTHHGPVIVTVASGAFSVINKSDCVLRVYPAGSAFVDPGQGNIHVGFNDGAVEAVVYATFLDVPVGQPATIPAAPACS